VRTCFGHLIEAVAPIDDRSQCAGLGKLGQVPDVVGALFGRARDNPLAARSRSPDRGEHVGND
jgi:hypothetical protein